MLSHGEANQQLLPHDHVPFVRVKMYGKKLDSLNAEVDKLLVDTNAQRKTSESCEISSFYYNSVCENARFHP
ncbi:hypothetical protein L596_010125 [Steinernema carpocapsae]|uniref:Uncharacterized protein n=1 Tax=Steinernema carpocapsae TaxID=34508 RepID=A0A4U5PHL3_STECR|nr:hypothetical protein L596_010125 [Steinernema carpocapsae]